MGTTIRLARPGDAAHLPAIERSAGERFRTIPAFAMWADADVLTAEIVSGKFAGQKESWLKDLNFEDPVATALAWATEGNAYICTTGKSLSSTSASPGPGRALTTTPVLPEGAAAIVGKELSGAYYQKAGPVVEIQVARAGYRMAAWLDLIAATYQARQSNEEAMGEL